MKNPTIAANLQAVQNSVGELDGYNGPVLVKKLQQAIEYCEALKSSLKAEQAWRK